MQLLNPLNISIFNTRVHLFKESDFSRFSAYKNYGGQTELSESEVTSSILKGHESMMAVLTTRGRNTEIIYKMWQNKDAKAGKYIDSQCA